MDPFPKKAEDMVNQIGDVTVSDVWGPAQTEGPSHEWYFYSFTDIKSRYLAIYFGNTKDEALRHFELYKVFIETQTGHKLKKFPSDNSGKYVNKNFKDFCGKHGIIMETTAPYSPAQNGIAKRLNQTLLKHAQAMIFSKNLPKTLWLEAITYACYIKNRSPMRALGSDITLFQALFAKKPDIVRYKILYILLLKDIYAQHIYLCFK